MPKPDKTPDLPPEQSPLDMSSHDGPVHEQSLIDYRIRPYRGESAFVIGTWIKSYEGAPGIKSVPRLEYRAAHEKLARALLDRGVAFVAEHEAHKTYLGFVAGERDREGSVIHYVYVKNWARQRGIGTALLDQLLRSLRSTSSSDGNVRYTHNTKEPFTRIAGKRGWHYSPYPAFRKGWEP